MDKGIPEMFVLRVLESSLSHMFRTNFIQSSSSSSNCKLMELVALLEDQLSWLFSLSFLVKVGEELEVFKTIVLVLVDEDVSESLVR